MEQRALRPGAVFDIPYPFLRQRVTLEDADGPTTVQQWRPGSRTEAETAEGEGFQTLRVVAMCRLQGRYQDRIFYTQQWLDPDGKTFGKKSVRVCGVRKFRTMIQGYRFPYSLPGQPSIREQDEAAYAAALGESEAEDAADAYRS